MDSEEQDRNMGPHNPYGKEKYSDTTPEFLEEGREDGSSGEDGGKKSKGVGQEAAETLNGAEENARKVIGAVGGNVKNAAELAAGLFQPGKKKPKAKKFAFTSVVVMFIMVVPLMFFFTSVPALLLRLMDTGLQSVAGIFEIESAMTEQATYIDQEALMNGEMPETHANELSQYGIEVGQVNLAGDFVKTNVYLADLDQNLNEVASSADNYQVNSSNGELSVRFKNKIVKGSDFVAALNSDPEMYGAYLESSTVFTKYMYSDEVSEEFFNKYFGITRETFAGWQRTGDKERDQESYEELLYKSIDGASQAYINGYQEDGASGDDESGEGSTVDVDGDAEFIISRVAEMMTGSNSTKKGAQALNVVISAVEPIKAANNFAATEEVLQRTIMYGSNKTPNMVAGNFATIGAANQNGGYASVAPYDQMIEDLKKVVETTYQDVSTGEEETIRTSVMDDENFQAALSGGKINLQEAQNFQRDRVLLATNTHDNEVINSSTLATNGRRKSSVVLEISGGDSADMEVLSNAKDPVSIAFSMDASDTTVGVIGSNRMIEGGQELIGKTALQTLAKLPSSRQVIFTYNRDINEIIAKQAEAERAVKSPFDIDSKYTFLGSVVNSLATSILTNRKSVSGGATTTSIIGTVASLAEKSADGLVGIVMADGPESNYANTIGINCDTVNSVMDLEGGWYCGSYGTMVLSYMSNTQADWDNDSDLTEETKKMVSLIGEGRNVTPGVKDGEICEIYKKEFLSEEEDVGSRVWRSLTDLLSKAAGLYDSCKDVPESVSLGGSTALSEQNENYAAIKKGAGYALYDRTKSVMYDTKSEMAAIRDEYFARNPRDESPEGNLARITGLSKGEIALAMDYANYLATISNYNPATRYAFGQDLVKVPIEMIFINDDEVESSVYLAWFGKIEYSDVRNRSFVI